MNVTHVFIPEESYLLSFLDKHENIPRSPLGEREARCACLPPSLMQVFFFFFFPSLTNNPGGFQARVIQKLATSSARTGCASECPISVEPACSGFSTHLALSPFSFFPPSLLHSCFLGALYAFLPRLKRKLSLLFLVWPLFFFFSFSSSVFSFFFFFPPS